MPGLSRAGRDSAPPEQKFQEALDYAAQRPELPLSFCMAATCDEGEKLLLMLRAEDGEAYIVPADQNREPVYLNATLERLLPRVQFVYDIRKNQKERLCPKRRRRSF